MKHKINLNSESNRFSLPLGYVFVIIYFYGLPQYAETSVIHSQWFNQQILARRYSSHETELKSESKSISDPLNSTILLNLTKDEPHRDNKMNFSFLYTSKDDSSKDLLDNKDFEMAKTRTKRNNKHKENNFIVQSESGPIILTQSGMMNNHDATEKISTDMHPSSDYKDYTEDDAKRDIESSSASSNYEYHRDVERPYFNEYDYVATTTNPPSSPPLNVDSPSNTKSTNYGDIYDDEDIAPERSDNANSEVGSFFDRANSIWNVFQAVNTAWNSIAEIHQKRQFEESQTNNISTEDDRRRRNSFYQLTPSDYTVVIENVESDEQKTTSTSLPSSTTETAVAEGRYIKGDPLKGYYDFVITEGSYKFWAAFQLVTALLIIYSTFAAIYYSKVNPLVGDYEYVDYLGGGRSLSDDVDFEDTDETNQPYRKSKPTGATNMGDDLSFTTTSRPSTAALEAATWPTSIWTSVAQSKWLSRAGHAFEFILEAIDKVPQ